MTACPHCGLESDEPMSEHVDLLTEIVKIAQRAERGGREVRILTTDKVIELRIGSYEPEPTQST